MIDKKGCQAFASVCGNMLLHQKVSLVTTTIVIVPLKPSVHTAMHSLAQLL